MSYITNKATKKRIDRFLSKNASYQAANVCITNNKERSQEINTHCDINFISPIREIDKAFYDQIILR